ncbi:MAG: hypothetical protein ABI462_04335 [Ignavibacteria bacterium]
MAYIQAAKYRSASFDLQSLYDKVKDAMNEIDLLVYVPIENPDLINCPESELPELRRTVNDIIKNYISDFKSVTNVMKVSGSVSKRSEHVVSRVSERGIRN